MGTTSSQRPPLGVGQGRRVPDFGHAYPKGTLAPDLPKWPPTDILHIYHANNNNSSSSSSSSNRMDRFCVAFTPTNDNHTIVMEVPLTSWSPLPRTWSVADEQMVVERIQYVLRCFSSPSSNSIYMTGAITPIPSFLRGTFVYLPFPPPPPKPSFNH
jgi:hypothetical protein